jgi:hypothetical protein
MRIYKIWARHTEKFKVDNWKVIGNKWSIDGKVDQEFNFIGGSNVSEEEAFARALLKRDKIKKKIDGLWEYRKDQDYTVDIREEIIAKIDDDNIITRNRYGALVLNSAHTMFVDIDTSHFSWRINVFKPFLKIIRLFTKPKTPDEEVLSHIDEQLIKSKFRNLYTRVYKTPAGFRLLISGEDFDPRSDKSKNIMRQFFADWTYANLCVQQNCYRARLTPKPWRIGVKRPKIIFPFRTTEQDKIHAEWVEQYQNKSESFAACGFIKSYGKERLSKVVQYHDQFCKALTNLPLA